MNCDIAFDLNMFADDTAIVTHGKVLADVLSQINHDMTKLTGWFNANKLTVNLGKTKYMFFSKNARDDCELALINVNGMQLEFVYNFSYLGIVLDNKLQFNNHIKNSIKKAGHKVYMLSRIRQYINTHTALIMFKSMILPYIEYGNIFNGTCNEAYKHNLQVIQNSVLKIALNRNILYRTVDLHIEAKILPCKHRRLMMLQKITFNEVRENVALLDKYWYFISVFTM